MAHPARVLVVVRPRERVRLEGSIGGQCWWVIDGRRVSVEKCLNRCDAMLGDTPVLLTNPAKVTSDIALVQKETLC